ncbi:TIGR03862 family flavoprotein [Acinetobacter sp. c3-l95]|uniref:TIGR03862 family flavoprotein n=1 Tax=Acinetobacter sp. c3-l95 TaxID=3342804 RepID=UPI0035B8B5F7
MSTTHNRPQKIMIIGAGPAGLACAEYLSQYNIDKNGNLISPLKFDIKIYEQKTSAGRKFLMAGKTGLNISHNEDFAQFIQRYDHVQALQEILNDYHAPQIMQWMQGLGIEPYIGSSGRIFPVEMKAAPLLRAWLKRLIAQGVKLYYQQQCQQIDGNQVQILDLKNQQLKTIDFDQLVLACGGASWSRLGSDGRWQQWLDKDEIAPLQASNVGVLKAWSSFMQPYFGQPLKRVQAWSTLSDKHFGEMVISHYGLEGGLVYRCQRGLRLQYNEIQQATLYIDLLPDIDQKTLLDKLLQYGQNKKLSLNTQWQKLGLDKTKIALLRDIVDKKDWSNAEKMQQHIKQLAIKIDGFRPMDEAISCAGGVKFSYLHADLSLKRQSNIYLCGEMLDWDAPTGGYLLTACLATGRHVAKHISTK